MEGYKTHVTSLARLILNSKKVILYNRKDIGYYVNLSNLSDIINTYEGITLLRNDVNDPEAQSPYFFTYIGESGFDIMIYLDDLENPVGFTEFHNIQGLLGEVLNIYIQHTINKIEIQVNIVNNLSHRPKKNDIGKGELDYMSANTARKLISRIQKYNKYGSSVCSDNIYLSYGLVKESITARLPKIQCQNIDLEGYNTNIGYIGDSLVLYIWSDLEYAVVPLEESSEIEFRTIEKFKEENSFGIQKTRNTKILYGSGKYLVCRIESGLGNFKLVLYDTELKKWISYKNENVIVDCNDRTQKILRLPSIDIYDTLTRVFPEIISTDFDLKDFLESNSMSYMSLILEKKVGDLFCFRCNDGNYILTSGYFSKILTTEEYENTIIINSGTIMTEYPDYYKFYPLNIESQKKDYLYETEFDNYRRQALMFYDIPKIIGACRGLIFYGKDNKINYL